MNPRFPHETQPGSRPVSGCRPLNPIDVAMHSVDRTIRGMGYSGFETQLLVWLAGRVEVSTLRQAIARLGKLYGAVNSRLMEQREGRSPAGWQVQPDENAELQEIDLPSSNPATVLTRAAELLSTSLELENNPPIRFYLIHRGDGGDVLLLQYNHVLMDNSGLGLVVREIDRLSRHPGGSDEAPHEEPKWVVNKYLRQFSHAHRREAARETFDLNRRVLQGPAATLNGGNEVFFRGAKLGVASREIDRERTRGVQAHLARWGGVPSLSMAILASAFRAIGRLGPGEQNVGRNFVAGIGLDLGLRSGRSPSFQNLMSVVPLSACAEDLENREDLVCILSNQLRARLETKCDLGIVRFAAGFSRRPRHIDWVIQHLLRRSYSLWYAYFGSLDLIGNRLCGVEINKAFFFGPTWSPIGISLLANQFHGCLFLQATYDPQLVPEQLANQFLDFVLGDLDS